MKPKVCQVLFSGLGGHGSVVFSMIDADRDRQWEHVLLFYGNVPAKEEYLVKCRKENIDHEAVLKKPGLSPGSHLSVLKFFKRQKPNVILLHTPSLILVAAWYCLFNRARLILIEHNPNQIKRKREWLCSWLGMFLARQIVYLTKEYVREMKKKLGVFFNSRKIFTIPNGIDIERYQTASGRDQQMINISMVARFTNTKDQGTLVKAVRHIINERPAGKIRLHLPGDGDTRGAVQNLDESKSPMIIFPGLLSEEGIIDLLSQTHIYVHSTLSETMSTSIMQAMACGLPVVASDVPGVSNLINNDNGLLFPVGDEQALKLVLVQLMNDDLLRKRLGHNAREYAVTTLSNKKMFDAYNELIISGRLN